jgi:hypothetical protein
MDAEVWHYRTPRHGVQGPVSLAQLLGWRPFLESRAGVWATLRVWRAEQAEADAWLLTTLLP